MNEDDLISLIGFLILIGIMLMGYFWISSSSINLTEATSPFYALKIAFLGLIASIFMWGLDKTEVLNGTNIIKKFLRRILGWVYIGIAIFFILLLSSIGSSINQSQSSVSSQFHSNQTQLPSTTEYNSMNLTIAEFITIIISIVALVLSLISIITSIKRNKTDVKIQIIKNDIRREDNRVKLLQIILNLQNRGGVSTSIEKISVLINNQIIKDNPLIFDYPRNLVVPPFQLDGDKTLQLALEMDFPETVEVIRTYTIKIEHTYGKVYQKLDIAQ